MLILKRGKNDLVEECYMDSRIKGIKPVIIPVIIIPMYIPQLDFTFNFLFNTKPVAIIPSAGLIIRSPTLP